MFFLKNVHELQNILRCMYKSSVVNFQLKPKLEVIGICYAYQKHGECLEKFSFPAPSPLSLVRSLLV